MAAERDEARPARWWPATVIDVVAADAMPASVAFANRDERAHATRDHGRGSA
jgi:hypothetical protein